MGENRDYYNPGQQQQGYYPPQQGGYGPAQGGYPQGNYGGPQPPQMSYAPQGQPQYPPYQQQQQPMYYQQQQRPQGRNNDGCLKGLLLGIFACCACDACCDCAECCLDVC